MYVSSKQKKRYVLITSIIALAIPLTVIASYFAVQFFTGAAPEEDPKGVVVSNLTSNSLTVTWVTEAQTIGALVTKINGKESKPYLDVRGSSKRYSHYVEINSLEPDSEYSFYITSNGKKYTAENGKDFKFKTSKLVSGTPVPKPVYGSVVGVSSDDYIIYVTTDSNRVFPATATVSSGGNWVVDLSALRDGTSELIKVESSTFINVIVRGKEESGSSIKGTYSELFSNEGKLNASFPLNITSTIEVDAILPSAAIIATIRPVVDLNIPKEPELEEPEEETPVEEEPEEEVPVEEEPVEEEPAVPIEDREFRYVKQVSLLPLAGTVGGVVDEDVVVDEQSVIISNLTDTGFTVSWTTKESVEGYIKYGLAKDALSNTGYDEKDSMLSKGKYTQHSVSVSRLQPVTEYFFEIISGTKALLDEGKPYVVKTFATLSAPPEFKTISGKVSGVSNPKDTTVIVKIEDKNGSGTTGISTISSSTPDEQGNWIVSIGDLRSSDGSTYYNASDSDSVTVSVLGLFESQSKDIEFADLVDSNVDLKVISLSTVSTPVKVAPLTTYGVYNAGVPTSNDNEEYGGIGGGSLEETPKTSIWVPSIILSILGILPILYFFLNIKKKKISMTDRVF